MNALIKRWLASLGLEIRRRDPSLPFIHETKLDDLELQLWITNQHARAWWAKPSLTMNAELRFLKEHASPGFTVFDVGAHHGIHAIPLSRWVEPSGRVFAFEANAQNALTLQANVALNSLSNCTAIHSAVAAKSGSLFLDGEAASVNGSLAAEVPATTLDDFCNLRGIGRVDLLKIDVEGFELEVLRGSSAVLNKRPHVNLELHLDSLRGYGATVEQVVEFLPSSDYDISFMERRHDWHKTLPMSSIADLPKTGVVNLFASRRRR